MMKMKNRMNRRTEIREKLINNSNRTMIRKNKYFMDRMMNRKRMYLIPKKIIKTV